MLFIINEKTYFLIHIVIAQGWLCTGCHGGLCNHRIWSRVFCAGSSGLCILHFTFNLILPVAYWPPASTAAERLGKIAIICLGILVESKFHLLQWRWIGLRSLGFFLSCNAHRHLKSEIKWSLMLKYSILNIRNHWKLVFKTVWKTH